MSFVIHNGDCREIMAGMEPASVDSIVTDPPYGLSFMGKGWDHGVPGEEFWQAARRVAKPGAFLLAFGGTRTFHRLACAIEDAGWQIRDCIMWVYGSGFPKSHNVSKAIDREAGAERQVLGYSPSARPNRVGRLTKLSGPQTIGGEITSPITDAARQWSGWGTALKPAWEPVIMARKPLDGTVAANVLAHGTGAINVDGCLVDSGRWPANLIHDGSEEVLAGFPDTDKAKASVRGGSNPNPMSWGETRNDADAIRGHNDNGGSAARFFFQAKHEKEDLLFCRAKAILSAWKLTKGAEPCSQENASVAVSSLCLSKQAAASVLSDAAIAASRGDRLLSDVRGLSTTVTERTCEMLCETLITAMLISESVALPAPSQDVLIQNGCRVSIAAILKQTDITTIMISLPTSDGFAEPVTFSITPSSMAPGARGSSANRLFYCAKASRADRDDGLESRSLAAAGGLQGRNDGSLGSVVMRRNVHPTVKPTDLMRYLCRLVTPPGGTVLDPFTGSGSTGKAAALEGFDFIGCELDPEYCRIAEARIAHAAAQGRLAI